MLPPQTVHLAFDVAAWATAGLASGLTRRRHRAFFAQALSAREHPDYYVHLCLGAALGALAFGSANLALAGVPKMGHSLAGALAGGIAGAEVYKLRRRIRGSTGLAFVLPLALGIVVGRLGCLLAGLADDTYGVATALPWGLDLGDGVRRHPVQLYESLSLFAFALVFFRALRAEAPWLPRFGFYAFVAYYAAQRFVWEFLKPYPPVALGLDVFQLLCAGLVGYAGLFAYRASAFTPPRRARPPASAAPPAA